MNNGGLNICPICEKRFIATLFWVYKKESAIKKTYYCSYHCFRKAGGGKGKFKNQPKMRGERYE